MALCNHCGESIITNAKFCSHCGKKNEEAAFKLDNIKPTIKVETVKPKGNKGRNFFVFAIVSSIIAAFWVDGTTKDDSIKEENSSYTYETPSNEISILTTEITKSTSQEIELGMTNLEVRNILGEPTEVLNTPADSKGEVRYRWFYINKGHLYFADNKVFIVAFKEYQKD